MRLRALPLPRQGRARPCNAPSCRRNSVDARLQCRPCRLRCRPCRIYAGASSGVAKAPASGVISSLLVSDGAYVNAGDALAQIASSADMTLRADLPERYAAQAPALTSARVGFSSSDSLFTLTRSAAAVSATSTPGYVPVYSHSVPTAQSPWVPLPMSTSWAASAAM